MATLGAAKLTYHYLLLLTTACVTCYASVLTPPVVPLAVRNPYLSTWLRDARDTPWNSRPIFWTGQELGLSLMASVPDSKTVFPLFGRPQDALNYDKNVDSFKLVSPLYQGLDFDASTTNFTYRIPAPSSDLDNAKLVVSFASPITPTSSLRQSIPASYISVHVIGGFDIDIYIDVNGDWMSGDANNVIHWYFQDLSFDDTKSLYSWQIEKEQPQTFTEFNDKAEWGKMHFSTSNDVKYQAGSASDVRRYFAEHSGLGDQVDQAFRRINDNEPVFAFHKRFHLGSAKESNSSSILFTIAYTQDEIVQYASARGLTWMRPLWKSYFVSEYELLMFHYADYRTSMRLGQDYSSQLSHDALKSGGPEYAEIVALSARQVLGATSFSGTPEAPLIFLKEISSNGNTQTVDVIFPSFPFFMYTNPRWLAYLLEPLLEHQLSGQYPNKYSMHDLGAHFPNLTGHFDGNDEYMPVEECGDMLIMALSLANSLQYSIASQAQSAWSALGLPNVLVQDASAYPMPLRISNGSSLDTFGMDDQWGGSMHGHGIAQSWVRRTYRILKQWTQYLIDEALEPANQLCTDDFAGWLPLQTNLALKGIIGINAMSDLASLIGQDADAKFYKNISTAYIKKWRDFGLSRDGKHAKLSYDWYGSWTTLYSLFSDAILCFHQKKDAIPAAVASPHLVAGQVPIMAESEVMTGSEKNSTAFISHDIYQMQSRHYENVMQRYGLPLDSRHLYTKSDWAMQSAAVASPQLRSKVFRSIAKWLNETNTDTPFSDLYETEGNGEYGAGNHFTARPVVGGHFASLALERACHGSAWTGYEDQSVW